MVSKEIQDGPPRRDTSLVPLVLHLCSGNDDQDLFSVWKDQESEWSSITAAISVGDALPFWHSWRRGEEFLFRFLCFLSWGMETLFNLKQVVLHQRNNSDQEVSGEAVLSLITQLVCLLTSYLFASWSSLLYCIFSPAWTVWKQFWNHLAMWEWHEGPHFCSGTTCSLLMRAAREES